MEALRQYALSIVTAALICAVISGFIQNNKSKEMIRFLCGVFLTVTVLSPVCKIDLHKIFDQLTPQALHTSELVEHGQTLADKAREDIIIEELNAYILDKAAALGAEVEVTVCLNENSIPVSAEICGNTSPDIRRQLSELLYWDLGITKENQLWTGNPQKPVS